MENAFYIVACRFHVREKDRLLITGYFLENRPDGNRIEIRLDGKKMFYTMDGIRLHPMKFRKIKKRLIIHHFKIVNILQFDPVNLLSLKGCHFLFSCGHPL